MLSGREGMGGEQIKLIQYLTLLNTSIPLPPTRFFPESPLSRNRNIILLN